MVLRSLTSGRRGPSRVRRLVLLGTLLACAFATGCSEPTSTQATPQSTGNEPASKTKTATPLKKFGRTPK